MTKNDKVTKLIVPLAGFGTRFLPSSSAYPKELTHLVDKPVLQYLVEEAYAAGIKEVIFIVNTQKGAIKKYFSERYQQAYLKKAFPDKTKIPTDYLQFLDLIKKIKFRFITKDSTMGDGHSVLLAKSFVDIGEPFAVSMGDLLGFSVEPFLKQLIGIYAKKQAPLISVQKGSREAIPKNGVIGIRKTIGRLHLVETIIEKPPLHLAPSQIIMTGKYILTPSIFPYLESLVKDHKSGEVKLADALRNFSQENDLFAYECVGKIQDTGNKLDFLKATIMLGLAHQTLGTPLKRFIKSLKI